MEKKLEHIELLKKYLESKLDAKEIKKVEKLLNSNREFRKMYEMIKSMETDIALGSHAELVSPLKKMSMNMFREHNKNKDDKKGNRGLPIYDSNVFPAPVGVRPSITNSRRLKYKIDDMDMEISLYPTSLYSYEIIGQLRGDLDSRYDVEISGKDFKMKTTTDELQMFVFTKIPAMNYRIKIRDKKKIIAVVDLEI